MATFNSVYYKKNCLSLNYILVISGMLKVPDTPLHLINKPTLVIPI